MSTWKVPAHALLHEQAKALARVLIEMEPDDPRLHDRRYRGSNGANRQNLRGLPAIGRGVSGAIHGTNPEQALMAKQNRRRPPPL